MKLRGWLPLIAFALIAYAATFFLFHKSTPAAHWRQNIDRQTAITLTQNAARQFGVTDFNLEADGPGITTTKVESEYGPRREYYLQTEPSGIGQPYFTPVNLNVRLLDFKTKRRVTAAINSNGKLLEFATSTPEERKSDDEQNNQPDKVSDADTELASSTIKTLWGETVLQSAKLVESSVTRQGSRFVWKTEGQPIKLLAKALVREGKIKQVSLEPEFNKSFDSAFEARNSTLFRVLDNAGAATIWPPVFLIAIFYIVGIALNRIQHKQSLIFLALVFVLLMVFNWLDGLSLDVNDDSGSYWVAKSISWGVFSFGMLFIASSLYFVWAAGESLAIRIPNRPTISIELILKAKLLTKPVARSFAAGVLSGGIVAAIPVLLAASGLFRGMELDANNLEDSFVSAFPAVSFALSGLQYLGFVTFGLMALLPIAYVKRPALSQALVYAIAVLGMLGGVAINHSAAGLIATTLLVALALTLIFFKGDLLTVIVSLGVSKTVIGALTLLAQPSATLQSSGWKAFAGLAALAIVSLIGVWKLREATEAETAVPSQLLENRDERERLKAEFSVAQRAQQQMLPDAPPQIPGLELSAICIPSKEVGGDLYDFLTLPDGKLGIVVADVSGKGVPASLYMTLTKGLLASVSETTSDPGEILCEVNRHLYEVCRRKMFVTLFLGVIDPITKRLTYARAGHNPTVFRRHSGETSLLRAGGIGLGLNSGKIFDKTLKVETIQLATNDKLFFYSDGITEAMNTKNEEYGEERLMNLAERLDGVGAEEARDSVLSDVTQFLGTNQPQDDQTLVVVMAV